MTILCILYLGAMIATIVSAIGKCPLWVPVLLMNIGLLMGCLSLR